VSEEKTVCTLIKGSMAATRRPSVRVNGVNVKYVSCVRCVDG